MIRLQSISRITHKGTIWSAFMNSKYDSCCQIATNVLRYCTITKIMRITTCINCKCQWLSYHVYCNDNSLIYLLVNYWHYKHYFWNHIIFCVIMTSSTAVSLINHMDILPGGPHMLPSQECIGFNKWISQVESELNLTSWAHISSLFSVKGLGLSHKLVVSH